MSYNLIKKKESGKADILKGQDFRHHIKNSLSDNSTESIDFLLTHKFPDISISSPVRMTFLVFCFSIVHLSLHLLLVDI